MFRQAGNSLFEGWSLADAKSLFKNSLSDTGNVGPCKSRDEEGVILPDKFDAREEWPGCISPSPAPSNCSSSYALAPISVVQDRICIASGGKKNVTLSIADAMSCDSNNYKCEGGYANRVLLYGKRKGFVEDSCLPWTGYNTTCPKRNECRKKQQTYRVIDMCFANDAEEMKKELKKNGPLVVHITPFTDFLTYKDGTYHRTEEAFKFNGMHLMKLLGWDKREDGQEVWIVQNSWGSDWGEDGIAKIWAGDKNFGMDQYALGVAVYPMTMAEYQVMQDQYEKGDSQGTPPVDLPTEDAPVEAEEGQAKEKDADL